MMGCGDTGLGVADRGDADRGDVASVAGRGVAG